MSSNEGSVQTLQSRDEPTASATTANSGKVANWWIWARFVAVIVLVVLALAVFFGAGFLTGSHHGGGHYQEDYLVPGEQAPREQALGATSAFRLFVSQRAWPGSTCAQHWVNCP